MEDVGVQETPENWFVAYLSVVSSNSIKTVLILVLLACFGGWGLTAETQLIYWSCILDPPIFKVHAWWNSEPPLSSNNTTWRGGAWFPQDGPLEKKWHWLSIPTNTVYVSEHLPACLSTLSDTLCLPVLSKWYAHAIDSEELQANISLVGAIGFKGEKHGDNSNPQMYSFLKLRQKLLSLSLGHCVAINNPHSLIFLTPH